ncbi:ethanolamine utilization protein EutJ, partial [Salmonella enterica]|uniref:ethanolamine utilization protein EutJ n=3 Tax=Salmonella enterica TaxID=28901 RepID=UPI0021753BCD
MAHDEQLWLTPRLQKAAALCNQTLAASDAPLWLGVDLGTCDVVSMVVDGNAQPVAVCLDWADVVRDGIVWDFFGAVTLVRRHLDTLEQQLGCRFTHAATSFPPGTDPRISISVLESAGLEVSHVLDEPTAVADLLALDNAGVVDIGGGTTGIAIVKQGKVTYSADEATGGHHISLTLAGERPIPLGKGGKVKRSQGPGVWAGGESGDGKMGGMVVRPIDGGGNGELWVGGGGRVWGGGGGAGLVLVGGVRQCRRPFGRIADDRGGRGAAARPDARRRRGVHHPPRHAPVVRIEGGGAGRR